MRHDRGQQRHSNRSRPSGLSPYSPAGQVEQWGDLATGWTSHRTGRRRAVRMLLWLAAVVVVLAVVLLLFH